MEVAMEGKVVCIFTVDNVVAVMKVNSSLAKPLPRPIIG